MRVNRFAEDIRKRAVNLVQTSLRFPCNFFMLGWVMGIQ